MQSSNTTWAEAAGKEAREGGNGGEVARGRGWREAQRASYCHWVGDFTLSDLSKNKTKTKNPNTTSN